MLIVPDSVITKGGSPLTHKTIIKSLKPGGNIFITWTFSQNRVP